MSQDGMGVLLHMLGGGSEHSADEYTGKIVESLWYDEEGFMIDFTDGTKITIWDAGQSCCESRYITCDDELAPFVGSVFRTIELKPAPTAVDRLGEEHEQMFVDIVTNEGTITFTTHNEHNGYYGGFGMSIRER